MDGWIFAVRVWLTLGGVSCLVLTRALLSTRVHDEAGRQGETVYRMWRNGGKP